MIRKVIFLSVMGLLVMCGNVLGAEYQDDEYTIKYINLEPEPETIVLSNNGSAIELTESEYLASSADVAFQFVTDKNSDIKRFLQFHKIRVDLVQVQIEAPLNLAVSQNVLLAKLRDFAHMNHCNYVRDIVVTNDPKNKDRCLFVTGKCGYGTTELQFNAWAAAVYREELVNSAFARKYEQMKSSHDCTRLNSQSYRYFVQDFENLKRESPAQYAAYLALEKQYLKMADKSDMDARSLDDTVYRDLRKTVRDQETASR